MSDVDEAKRVAREARNLRPFVLRWIDEALQGAGVQRRGGGVVGAHTLSGPEHSGTLRDDQGPQFLLASGLRRLDGDLPVADGRKLDGVDLSAFYTAYLQHTSNPGAHHEPFSGFRTAGGQNIDPDAGLRISWLSGNGTALRRVTGNSLAVDLRLASPSGLNVNGGLLQVDGSLAGDALSFASGVLHVRAGTGLLISGDAVALQTPGALSVSSPNSAAGAHTHSIISSDAPGAARALLSTSGTGLLTLWELALTRTTDATALTVTRGQGRTTPALVVIQPASVGAGSGRVLEARTAATGQPRMALFDTGLGLGPGGSSALDVFLTRSSTRTARLSGDGAGALPANLLIEGWLAVGRGEAAAPPAPLTVRSSTAQIRLEHASAPTRGYFDLQVDAGGNVTLAPQGILYVNPRGRAVLPSNPYETDLGSFQNKFLALHAAELRVETLVAQQTLATIGGRVLVGPTTQLVEPLSSVDTSVRVKHNALSTNDILILEAGGQVEFVQVTGAQNNPVRNASFESWDGASTFTFWTPVGTGVFAQTLTDPVNGRAALRVSS